MRGGSSTGGSSFPSTEKRRKVFIEGGMKVASKTTVTKRQPGNFKGGKRSNPSTYSFSNPSRGKVNSFSVEIERYYLRLLGIVSNSGGD